MIMAQVGVSVPKFTVIVNGSFGAGNYGMCGRAFDGRFLFMWPQSQIAVMGARAGRQHAGRGQDPPARAPGPPRSATPRSLPSASRCWSAYRAESDAYYSTSELWDDGILDPIDTRNALGIAIVASLNAPFGEPGYGVLRL